jgi:hypothetical protein
MSQPATNTSPINAISNSGELSSLDAPGRPAIALSETHSPKQLPKPRKRNTKSLAKSATKEGRCRHYTSTGRRCRLAVLDTASGLCFRHVGLQFQVADEDLSPAFLGLLTGFHSAPRIHAFLSQVTVLLVQNRISTRRAAILAYLGQILLRNLPALSQPENVPKDSDPIELFPPHLQELIEHKRRIAQQAHARTLRTGADSLPERREDDANAMPLRGSVAE